MSCSSVKIIIVFHKGIIMIIVISKSKLLQCEIVFVDVAHKLRKHYSSISQLL